jgi:hypothetical protein
VSASLGLTDTVSRVKQLHDRLTSLESRVKHEEDNERENRSFSDHREKNYEQLIEEVDTALFLLDHGSLPVMDGLFEMKLGNGVFTLFYLLDQMNDFPKLSIRRREYLISRDLKQVNWLSLHTKELIIQSYPILFAKNIEDKPVLWEKFVTLFGFHNIDTLEAIWIEDVNSIINHFQEQISKKITVCRSIDQKSSITFELTDTDIDEHLQKLDWPIFRHLLVMFMESALNRQKYVYSYRVLDLDVISLFSADMVDELPLYISDEHNEEELLKLISDIKADKEFTINYKEALRALVMRESVIMLGVSFLEDMNKSYTHREADLSKIVGWEWQEWSSSKLYERDAALAKGGEEESSLDKMNSTEKKENPFKKFYTPIDIDN